MNIDRNKQGAVLDNAYRGKRVLVTGHTGVCGSWLCLMLERFGANISGLALEPNTNPSLFVSAEVESGLNSNIGDIRDFDVVDQVVRSNEPEIIFHLAAQPLVRVSYADPIGTFSTNMMGTVHVLDAARRCPSVQALVIVTTDKVYKDQDWSYPYREMDELGGHDPYSASKAAADLVSQSYRASYFDKEHRPYCATVRGGNIICGGDWAEDRLVPDIVRAVSSGQRLSIRNPAAVRPWQHVLSLCHGYLLIGERLLQKQAMAADSWNIGPDANQVLRVEEIVSTFAELWKPLLVDHATDPLIETAHLSLESQKIKNMLGWESFWDIGESLKQTVRWYKSFYEAPSSARRLCREQIESYFSL